MGADNKAVAGGRVVVILDNPLLDADPWADAVFAAAGLVPVENAAIIKAMSQDPDAKKALLANLSNPMDAQETLSPHYRKALATLYGEQPRLGIYGTAWLVHVDQVDACVVDWSEVEKRAHAPGVSEQDRALSLHVAKTFVHDRVKEHLPDGGRYHELPTGLNERERINHTLEFLKSRDVT